MVLLIEQKRRTNKPRTALFATITAIAIVLVPTLAMAQDHGGGRGRGGPGGPGGGASGSHTTHDDGHSSHTDSDHTDSSHTDGATSHSGGHSGGKKGGKEGAGPGGKGRGYDITRGKGRGPASLRDVFRDMGDAMAQGHGRGRGVGGPGGPGGVVSDSHTSHDH